MFSVHSLLQALRLTELWPASQSNMTLLSLVEVCLCTQILCLGVRADVGDGFIGLNPQRVSPRVSLDIAFLVLTQQSPQ